ncbi:PleD family two-component system response regulator [Aurantimonas sp. HBX-1]|uniref:PleD family two-component system response regulator n=1 Tax=Aurantimonas sp. HBX-1 TaxID=2906072 RepID=UPI001F1DB09B|nr:PleD family two-component system response regulator [Aurantimonas sp. HBX-1]UIJ73632.1 PleD family two-component system response regulator [Aurantimonas sp. HBX-1]
MTARILLVDDIELNLKLLEARLTAEYYQVVTATNGVEALRICQEETVDLVLLDVMMPGMDGFEVCRRLKADPRTTHLPVVLITALDQASDRLTGLEAGADDFLTKPVRDLALFSRVRSLTRLKFVTDELRRRAETAVSLMAADTHFRPDLLEPPPHVLLFSESAEHGQRVRRHLRGIASVDIVDDAARFGDTAAVGVADVLMIDMDGTGVDPLRLISQLRTNEASRLTPILASARPDNEARLARALELGGNDYIHRPIDRNELVARVRTQIRRKRYDDGLRHSVQRTIQLAVSDPLTGLHNRRFLETHMARAVAAAQDTGAGFALLMADIDHFKRINDNWGHDAGDRVLQEFATRLSHCLRSSDLACRFGGEEFAILMIEADAQTAVGIAERIRQSVCERPFVIDGNSIVVTVSEGLAVFEPGRDDAQSLLKRADAALYAAKRAGRNRVEVQRAA